MEELLKATAVTVSGGSRRGEGVGEAAGVDVVLMPEVYNVRSSQEKMLSTEQGCVKF